MSMTQSEKDLRAELEAHFPECFQSKKYERVNLLTRFTGCVDADIGSGHIMRTTGSEDTFPGYETTFHAPGGKELLKINHFDCIELLTLAKRRIDTKIVELMELKSLLDSSGEIKKAEEAIINHLVFHGLVGSDLTVRYLTQIFPSHPMLLDGEGKTSYDRLRSFVRSIDHPLYTFSLYFDENGAEALKLLRKP